MFDKIKNMFWGKPKVEEENLSEVYNEEILDEPSLETVDIPDSDLLDNNEINGINDSSLDESTLENKIIEDEKQAFTDSKEEFEDKPKEIENKPVREEKIEDIGDINIDDINKELEDTKQDDIDSVKIKKDKEKQEKLLLKKAQKEARKKVVNKIKENIVYMSPQSKAFLSNLFLIITIVFSYYLFSNVIVDSLKNIEVYKTDIKTVTKDSEIISSNLQLLDEEKNKALEYRRLNYFLNQAVPQTDKYEDNLVVILQILSESISAFSRNTKYLDSLSLKPNAKLQDIEIFNSETEKYYELIIEWQFHDLQGIKI